MAHNSNTGRTDTIRSDHTPSIPIRVIPGNTELVKDTSSGAFHLNVGFHLSFNVKDLMQSLATLTNVDVNIKAESSVPISAQTVQQPPVQMEKDPPQKKNDEKREHFPGFGGPLKTMLILIQSQNGFFQLPIFYVKNVFRSFSNFLKNVFPKR